MTGDMILFLVVLGLTILLFVFEWVRVDVVALIVLVTLPWLGLVTPEQALSGLSSNAVVSIIGVMILGYGIDRTGVMARFTRPVMALAGGSERRLVGLVSLAVGLLSGFMQNIGAAALFLPALLRISKRSAISPSRLLMPMGFSAILGGTLTMVASGPLILLNDLLAADGEGYGLFDVTPIGLALLLVGLLYFAVLGKRVLPQRSAKETPDPQRQIVETWGLPKTIYGAIVASDSPLVGGTIEEASPWPEFHVNVVALRDAVDKHYAPWRSTRIDAGHELALLGAKADVDRFIAAKGLIPGPAHSELIDELQSSEFGGFAEVIVRPRAAIVGQTLRQIALRKNHVVEPVLLLSGDRPVQHDYSDEPLMPGDTLVVHGRWDRIRALGEDPSFVLLTPVKTEETASGKGALAVVCFVAAIGLAVAGFSLSISLMSGALAMILLGIVPIDAAYRAVDWRTVFLLAGLIPLGQAMEGTGTAAWMVGGITSLLHGAPTIVLLASVALLTTVLSLFISNVAATVLLVPLVAQLGESAGVAPAALGLLVAVCASNSFLLPTHQVNALLLGPGGYRNADYLKAGGIMTVLFLVVAVTMIWLFYLG